MRSFTCSAIDPAWELARGRARYIVRGTAEKTQSPRWFATRAARKRLQRSRRNNWFGVLVTDKGGAQ